VHEEFAMPQFQPTIFPDFRFPLSGNIDQTINPWTCSSAASASSGPSTLNSAAPPTPISSSRFSTTWQLWPPDGPHQRRPFPVCPQIAGQFDPDERKAIAAFQRLVEGVNALKDKRERRLALAQPA
jgi:hypothetical protein